MNRRLTLPFLALALNLSLPIVPAAGADTAATDPPIDSDNREPADSIAGSNATRPMFRLSRVDKDVVTEFEKAWWISSNGTNGKEGAVLIFQALDGSYFARLQRKTNEQKKITFTWVPNAIAIVHTHPNRTDPKPSLDDMRLADRLKVPMFTISLYGMWVYDPATKKTRIVHQGLDWLDPEKWTRRAQASKESELLSDSADSSQFTSRSSQKDSVPAGLSLH